MAVLIRALLLGVLTSFLLTPQLAACPAIHALDWRFLPVVASGGYREMGYMVKLPTGKIAMTMTVGSSQEGGADQHVEMFVSADDGATWTARGDIDPKGSEVSWGMPWVDSNGRLYVVSLWNKNNIRSIPFQDVSGASQRVDTIGWPRVVYSDDEGVTWQAVQGPLPGQEFAIYDPTDVDTRNPFAGVHKLSWLSGNVIVRDGFAYYGFSKRGRVESTNSFGDTEAFIGRFAVSPQSNSDFAVLPAGNTGIRSPVTWPSGSAVPASWLGINEEPSFDFDDDGLMYGVFRTNARRVAEFVSTDGGQTITTAWAQEQDSPAGLTLYHPRAAPMVKNLGNGKWFLWHHNNASSGWGNRSVVWFRLGTRSGNRVVWGKPRALAFSDDQTKGVSYPSIPIDLGDRLLFSAGDKSSVRTFTILKSQLCD